MQIDVTPKVIIATGSIRTIIDVCDKEALYYIGADEDTVFSTIWDRKTLAEFQPNKTVSEMLKTWQDGVKRRIEFIEEIIVSNKEPYRPYEKYAPCSCRFTKETDEKGATY